MDETGDRQVERITRAERACNELDRIVRELRRLQSVSAGAVSVEAAKRDGERSPGLAW